MMWLIIGICTILSAMFYRMGGKGKPFASWMRDWVCPLFALVALCQFGVSHDFWVYLIFYGLSGAALSTYWDWLFGYDNFWFHGFACGLVGFIMLLAGIPWYILVFRLVLCTLMGLWSKMVSNATVEELGRGALFVL